MKRAFTATALPDGIAISTSGTISGTPTVNGTFNYTVTVLAALLSAADVTGTWKGAFDYSGTSIALTFNLKSTGDTVTGTIDGLPSSSAKIEDGKLQGEDVSFWITIDYQGQPLKLVYKGKVSSDQIQFSFGTDDGSCHRLRHFQLMTSFRRIW